MANRRVLVKRRDSTRNIRKITRTMQLIATARFQAAFKRATAGKPYTEKLTQLISGLARASTGLDHPLMKTHDTVDKGALLVLTSDRGLCGGYNANILRAVAEGNKKGHRPHRCRTRIQFIRQRRCEQAPDHAQLWGVLRIHKK